MKHKIMRYSRSALSVLLTFCMLLSCVTVGIMSTAAATADEDESVGASTVYFLSNSDWGSNIKIYTWSTETAGVWPGTAMTSLGSNLYSYTTTGNFTGCKIHDGDTRNTGDLDAQNGKVYVGAGGRAIAGWYDYSPTTFYVKNDANWSTVYVHLYDTEQVYSWQGRAVIRNGAAESYNGLTVTDVGGGVFRVVSYVGNIGKLILNNGSGGTGNQTQEFTLAPNTVYNTNDSSTPYTTEPKFYLTGNINNEYIESVNGSTTDVPTALPETNNGWWETQFEAFKVDNTESGSKYSIEIKTKSLEAMSPWNHTNVNIGVMDTAQRGFNIGGAYFNKYGDDYVMAESGISDSDNAYLVNKESGGSIVLRPDTYYKICIDQSSTFDSSNPYGKITIINQTAEVKTAVKKTGFNPTTGTTESTVYSGDATVGSATASPARVKIGTTTTLSAVSAGEEYTFAGWYSDEECTEANKVSTSASYSPTVNSDITYYALFTASAPAQKYSVTAVSNDDSKGTVSITGGLAAEGGTKAYKGATVTLQASPAAGYVLKRATTTSGTANVNGNTITLSGFTADCTVTAEFGPETGIQFTAKSSTGSNHPTVKKDGADMSNSGGTLSATDGNELTLTAKSISNWTFTKWVIEGGPYTITSGSLTSSEIRIRAKGNFRAVAKYVMAGEDTSWKFNIWRQEDGGSSANNALETTRYQNLTVDGKTDIRVAYFTVNDAASGHYYVQAYTGNDYYKRDNNQDLSNWVTLNKGENVTQGNARFYHDSEAGTVYTLLLYCNTGNDNTVEVKVIKGEQNYSGSDDDVIDDTDTPSGYINIYAKNGTYSGTADWGYTKVTAGSALKKDSLGIPSYKDYESKYKTYYYKDDANTSITVQTEMKRGGGWGVLAYVVNGETYMASQVGSSNVFKADIDIPAGSGELEITPVYYNKTAFESENNPYTKFYVDASTLGDAWADKKGHTTLGCYTWYNSGNGGSYPGQPMLKDGSGKYYMYVSEYYIKSDGTVQYSDRIQGVLLDNYWENEKVHKHFMGYNGSYYNLQTYDYYDPIAISKISHVDTIQYVMKYKPNNTSYRIPLSETFPRTSDSNTDSNSNHLRDTKSDSWSHLAKKYNDQYNLHDNTTSNLSSSITGESYYEWEDLTNYDDEIINLNGDVLEGSTEGTLYVISVGNQKWEDTDSGEQNIGKWATVWKVYKSNGELIATAPPSYFIEHTETDEYHLIAETYSNYKVKISYEHEEVVKDASHTGRSNGTEKNSGIRIDGRWLYSKSTDATNAKIVVVEENTAHTGYQLVANNAGGTADIGAGYDTKEHAQEAYGAAGTLTGTDIWFPNRTTNGTMRINVGDGYIFKGFRYMKSGATATDTLGTGKGFSETKADYVDIPSSGTAAEMTIDTNYHIVAVVEKLPETDLNLTHEKLAASTGKGYYYLTYQIVDGSDIVITSGGNVTTSPANVTITNFQAYSNHRSDYKLKVTLRTDPIGSNTFVGWYENDHAGGYDSLGDNGYGGKNESATMTKTYPISELFNSEGTALIHQSLNFYSELGLAGTVSVGHQLRAASAGSAATVNQVRILKANGTDVLYTSNWSGDGGRTVVTPRYIVANSGNLMEITLKTTPEGYSTFQNFSYKDEDNKTITRTADETFTDNNGYIYTVKSSTTESGVETVTFTVPVQSFFDNVEGEYEFKTDNAALDFYSMLGLPSRSLTITKAVDEFNSTTQNDEFTFEIKSGSASDSLSLYTGAYTAAGTAHESGTGTVTIKKGESIVIENITAGTWFSVQETNAGSYYTFATTKLDDESESDDNLRAFEIAGANRTILYTNNILKYTGLVNIQYKNSSADTTWKTDTYDPDSTDTITGVTTGATVMFTNGDVNKREVTLSYGDTYAYTETTDTGWTFAGWYLGDTAVTVADNAVDEDKTFTARFVKNDPQPTATVKHLLKPSTTGTGTLEVRAVIYQGTFTEVGDPFYDSGWVSGSNGAAIPAGKLLYVSDPTLSNRYKLRIYLRTTPADTFRFDKFWDPSVTELTTGSEYPNASAINTSSAVKTAQIVDLPVNDMFTVDESGNLTFNSTTYSEIDFYSSLVKQYTAGISIQYLNSYADTTWKTDTLIADTDETDDPLILGTETGAKAYFNDHPKTATETVDSDGTFHYAKTDPASGWTFKGWYLNDKEIVDTVTDSDTQISKTDAEKADANKTFVARYERTVADKTVTVNHLLTSDSPAGSGTPKVKVEVYQGETLVTTYPASGFADNVTVASDYIRYKASNPYRLHVTLQTTEATGYEFINFYNDNAASSVISGKSGSDPTYTVSFDVAVNSLFTYNNETGTLVYNSDDNPIALTYYSKLDAIGAVNIKHMLTTESSGRGTPTVKVEVKNGDTTTLFTTVGSTGADADGFVDAQTAAVALGAAEGIRYGYGNTIKITLKTEQLDDNRFRGFYLDASAENLLNVGTETSSGSGIYTYSVTDISVDDLFAATDGHAFDSTKSTYNYYSHLSTKTSVTFRHLLKDSDEGSGTLSVRVELLDGGLIGDDEVKYNSGWQTDAVTLDSDTIVSKLGNIWSNLAGYKFRISLRTKENDNYRFINFYEPDGSTVLATGSSYPKAVSFTNTEDGRVAVIQNLSSSTVYTILGRIKDGYDTITFYSSLIRQYDADIAVEYRDDSTDSWHTDTFTDDSDIEGNTTAATVKFTDTNKRATTIDKDQNFAWSYTEGITSNGYIFEGFYLKDGTTYTKVTADNLAAMKLADADKHFVARYFKPDPGSEVTIKHLLTTGSEGRGNTTVKVEVFKKGSASAVQTYGFVAGSTGVAVPTDYIKYDTVNEYKLRITLNTTENTGYQFDDFYTDAAGNTQLTGGSKDVSGATKSYILADIDVNTYFFTEGEGCITFNDDLVNLVYYSKLDPRSIPGTVAVIYRTSADGSWTPETSYTDPDGTKSTETGAIVNFGTGTGRTTAAAFGGVYPINHVDTALINDYEFTGWFMADGTGYREMAEADKNVDSTDGKTFYAGYTKHTEAVYSYEINYIFPSRYNILKHVELYGNSMGYLRRGTFSGSDIAKYYDAENNKLTSQLFKDVAPFERNFLQDIIFKCDEAEQEYDAEEGVYKATVRAKTEDVTTRKVQFIFPYEYKEIHDSTWTGGVGVLYAPNSETPQFIPDEENWAETDQIDVGYQKHFSVITAEGTEQYVHAPEEIATATGTGKFLYWSIQAPDRNRPKEHDEYEYRQIAVCRDLEGVFDYTIFDNYRLIPVYDCFDSANTNLGYVAPTSPLITLNFMEYSRSQWNENQKSEKQTTRYAEDMVYMDFNVAYINAQAAVRNANSVVGMIYVDCGELDLENNRTLDPTATNFISQYHYYEETLETPLANRRAEIVSFLQSNKSVEKSTGGLYKKNFKKADVTDKERTEYGWGITVGSQASASADFVYANVRTHVFAAYGYLIDKDNNVTLSEPVFVTPYNTAGK